MAKNKNQKVHFKELDSSEVNKRLKQALDSQCDFVVWKKQDQMREKYTPIVFSESDSTIKLKAQLKSNSKLGDVLISFEVLGVKYFTTGKLSKNSDSTTECLITGKIFKSERRKNYRLASDGIYQISVHFTDNMEIENVVSIKRGTGFHTNLFRNFLKLVNNEDGTHHVSLKALDLSAAGVSFSIGEIEAPHFEKDKVFKNFYIRFSGIEYLIPKGRVVYVVDYVNPSRKNIKLFKVGMEFIGLPESTDIMLASQINQELEKRDNRSDFEDFIDS